MRSTALAAKSKAAVQSGSNPGLESGGLRVRGIFGEVNHPLADPQIDRDPRMIGQKGRDHRAEKANEVGVAMRPQSTTRDSLQRAGDAVGFVEPGDPLSRRPRGRPLAPSELQQAARMNRAGT
jgi:hypothetical protein